MPDAPKPRSPRIPPGNRSGIFILSPLIVAFGIWTMISGRIGRGPTPIEGTPAVILGAVFVAFAVIVFAIAWSERGLTDA